MDKLNTLLNGGFPYDLDDWRWGVNSLMDGLKALGDGMGPNCIVTGCTYTVLGDGKVGYVQPGWVMIDGELCRFIGGNGVGYIPLFTHFVITESLDASGVETFEDGTVQNAYTKRRATLVGGAAPTPSCNIIGPNLRRTLLTQSDWQLVGTAGQPAFETAWSHPVTGATVAFRKEMGVMVRLRGVVNAGVGITDLIPFILPVGYRPFTSVFGNLASIANPSLEHCVVEIRVDGAIVIYNGNLTGNDATYDLIGLPVFDAG